MPVGYQDALDASRTFQSPNCVEAMAEVYGSLPSLAYLRGSLQECPSQVQAVQDLRERMKAEIGRAWSLEAVRKGVAKAKAGDYASACKLYEQVCACLF